MLHGFLKYFNLTDISAPVREIIAICKRPFFRYVASKKFNKIKRKHSGTVNIEIGAGNRKGDNGWITLDISRYCDICWDLRWELPFPNNSVTMIYSSHVLEHFYFKDLIKIMKECYRILIPGGEISICVPNAKIYIDGYIENHFENEDYFQYKPAVIGLSKIDIINYIAYMNGHHRHMFDIDELIELLKISGFLNIRQRQYDPLIDLAARKYESIYAIGYKPK
jgi:predicted SAM-dependent methyltransferase